MKYRTPLAVIPLKSEKSRTLDIQVIFLSNFLVFFSNFLIL